MTTIDTSTTEAAEQLLDDACDLGNDIARLLDEVNRKARERRRLWLLANRRGASYLRIRQRCGVSETTVCKEIQKARAEHPTFAKSPRRGRPKFPRSTA